MPGRILIVNADDYALTEGICRAVLRGHRDGVVTSTSVMANGPAFDCAKWLGDVPDLGVGVHLALVSDDPPMLPAKEIRSLVDRKGTLAASWTRLLPRLTTGRIDADDVERELDAQIAAVADVVGRDRLTHLDSHQHLHLWPSIGKVVVRLADRWDIPGVRVTRSFSARPVGVTLNLLARRLRRRCAAAGLRTTDAFAGFDEGGSLKQGLLIEAVTRLGATGARTAELATHPGEVADGELGPHHWPYHRADELAGVLSPEVRGAIERAGFTLGTYADLWTKAHELYRSASRATRLHTRLRWWWCPFDALEAAVPIKGDVLEIGCGHGLCSLHLALAAPGRAVVGVDIDADKVADARQAAERLRPGRSIRFDVVDPDWRPDAEQWDAIVVADVLYLLPEDDQRRLVVSAAHGVRPGGVVVLKELALTPGWKLRWQRVQETLATRVFRVTDSVGRGLTFVGTEAMADWLRAEGLDASVQRVDKGYPWPHSLVVARKER